MKREKTKQNKNKNKLQINVNTALLLQTCDTNKLWDNGRNTIYCGT